MPACLYSTKRVTHSPSNADTAALVSGLRFYLNFWTNLVNTLQVPARVAEMVDARDLKSLEAKLRAGSIPAPGTRK